MSRVARIPDPIAAVVAGARRRLGEEEQPRGSNRSPRIDYWLLENGVPVGNAWCLAFLNQTGREALGLAWPVPRGALVQRVYEWAEGRGIVHGTPEVGDFYLRWYSSLNRYAHIGLVLEVHDGRILTVDGNTTDGGSREGYAVLERNVPLVTGLKFVRWVDALTLEPAALHRAAM